MAEFESYDEYVSRDTKTETPASAEFDSYDAYSSAASDVGDGVEFDSYDEYSQVIDLGAKETQDQNIYEPMPLGVDEVPAKKEKVVEPAQKKDVPSATVSPTDFFSRMVQANLNRKFEAETGTTPIPDETTSAAREYDALPSVLDSSGNVDEAAIRRSTFAAYERGEFSQLKDSKWGTLEGLAGVATGSAGFIVGMGQATAELPVKFLKDKLDTGDISSEDVARILNEVNKSKDIIAEHLTYMPENIHAKNIMEFASWPFAKAHDMLEEKLSDQSEDVRGAAHYLLDAAFVAGPKLAKESFKLGKTGMEKFSKGEAVTEAEAVAAAEVTPERVVSAEISKIEEGIAKVSREKEAELVKQYEKESLDDFIGEVDREPNAAELSKEEKLLQRDAVELAMKEDRVTVLQMMHEEWQKKRATADAELREQIGVEARPETAVDVATDKNYPKGEEITAPKVESLDSRVTGSMLYTDEKITAERAKLYADEYAAKRASSDPSTAVQKLVNDVNRSVHGDSSVDLAKTSELIRMIGEQSDTLRAYFVGDSQFDSFRSLVDDAFVFSETVRGKESKGITLSSGVDPTEFYPAVIDTIKSLKALAGKVSPDRARNALAKQVGLSELDRSGLLGLIDTAKAEGKKLTREDLIDAVKPLRIEKEVVNAYENVARVFPNNKLYEDHLYILDAPMQYYSPHYKGVRNVIMSARVSFDPATATRVVEELQSDYFQQGAIRKSTPFSNSWERQVIVRELVAAAKNGADNFGWSTGDSVIAAEGILKEGAKKSIRTRYDNKVPKIIKNVLHELGEKAEIKIVESDAGQRVGSISSTVDSISTSIRELDRLEDYAKIPLDAAAYDKIAKVMLNVKQTMHRFNTPDALSMHTINAIDSVKLLESTFALTQDKSISTQKAILNRTIRLRRSLKRWRRRAKIANVTAQNKYHSIEITNTLRDKLSTPQGITFRSGLDPVEAFKLAKEGIKFFSEKKLDTTARRWWDTTARLKKHLDGLNTDQAYETYKRIVLRQGGSSKASHHTELVRKAVFGGVNRSGRNIIDDIMFYRRVEAIDLVRMKEALSTGKVRKVNHPAMTTGQVKRAGLPGVPDATDVKSARAALAGLKARLGEKKFAELNSRVDIAFGAMKDMLKTLKDEGVISTKLYNKLKDIDYLPRRELIAAIDPTTEYKIGKIPLTMRESGVTVLKKGTTADKLEMDSELLIADVIQSTYGRIFRNNTNKALLEMVKTDPENGIAKIPTPRSDGRLPSPPTGWSRVDLFVDGKKQGIFLKNDFARDWLSMDREISFDLLRRIQIASGSAAIRITATGLSNAFALVNSVKDPLHIYFTNQVKMGDKWRSVYSSNPIRFVAQYSRDAASIARDITLKTGEYLDAQTDGALMMLKAQEGRIFRRHRNVQSPVDHVLSVLGAIPERSELIGRLAVRKRAMRMLAKRLGLDWNKFEAANKKLRPIEKNGRLVVNPEAKNVPKELADQIMKIRREGSFASRDYMDYANHGTVGEFANAGIPFFNAGMQGTRGLFRAAARDPKGFTKKLTWLGATASGIYLYNVSQHKEKYDLVSKNAKMKNFILMTDWSFVDENGDTRWVYGKMPKDNSQVYFAGAVEAAFGKYVLGQDVDMPGVTDALKSFSPVDSAVPSIPTLDMLLGTSTNFDLKRSLWEGKTRQVWSGPKTDKEHKFEEYDQYTPAWAVGLGKMTNSSPAQLKHFVDAYFARNEWTALSGKFFDKMFGPEAQEAKEITLAQALTEYPISRRFFGATLTESEKVKEADVEDIQSAALDSFIVNRGMRTLVSDELINGKGNLDKLFEYKDAHPKYAEKLQRDIDFALTLQRYGQGYRKFWLRMRGPTTVETKARMFYRRYQVASGDEKVELDFHRKKFGYDTEKFNQALMDVEVLGENK